MDQMEWTADLKTGIHEVDEQHMQIFTYINNLVEISSDRQNDKTEIRKILQGLVDYTISHLDFEESLMEKAGYAGIAEHKEAHKVFKARIANYIQRADRGENVVAVVTSMLKLWLVSHIKSEDKKYVSAVQPIMVKERKSGGISGAIGRFFRGG